MKCRKSPTNWLAVFAAFLIAWMQMSPTALAANPASQATKDIHDQVLLDLPFENIEDFDLATRGFIARLEPPIIEVIEGEENDRPAWDLEPYNFLLDGQTVPSSPDDLPEAPYTVNPSLWRISQLNMQHGLYEVVPGIYQVRGYDLSVMTLVEGHTGWILIDPLTSKETAKAALDLANANIANMQLPRHPRRTKPLPVSAVIYTHSHVDHFAGVQGVIAPEDVKSEDNPDGVPIYAPEGFLEEAVSENVFVGDAMSRRGSYMYGTLLPKGIDGQVDSGLGKTTSSGQFTLIAPTDIIDGTMEDLPPVDGIRIQFQNVPGSEAPAEIMFYFPEFHALCASEDATHTLHNLYTLRGAKVRDSLAWANYLSETIELFGDDVEVVFASHHWPTWDEPGTPENEVVEYLKKQRDLYKYIHDQTLHQANKGYTMLEIAEDFKLPDSLANEWYNRGYYGSINHNVKAVYQRYLGWFDGNPAHLHSLPPEQAGAKYIEYMGGPAVAIEKAETDYENGKYRWVAQVMSDLVFGFCKDNDIDLDCLDAKQLEADALEQMGYQAESGPWRNFFLTGAQELRDGVNTRLPVPDVISAEVIHSMTSDLIFDYLAIKLDGWEAAKNEEGYKFNVIFPDTSENYLLSVENGVLTYTNGKLIGNPNTTIFINRTDLDDVILGDKEISEVVLSHGGELQDFQDFWSLLDLDLEPSEFWFNIVLP
ncbi:MAG: MBL fold metallo-hydrolase [Okeania sp. SIO3I5]|uniref:alkyl/aryl-sulfatase n=1 Tax=Okeania sp. SIO3I5 TaxID=2607805 RepID=UPI0013BAE2BD|nr:alkyl sulfatase dimerization domain-containing protein [Okeania sp. SIO3I5]NEQ36770.1 MBL fold metallo-hydrolase [Okeania sp. SIO3I5]